MKKSYFTNLRQYLMLALFMVLPGIAIDTRTAEASGAGKSHQGAALPPIDQDVPKVFETASFGLG